MSRLAPKTKKEARELAIEIAGDISALDDFKDEVAKLMRKRKLDTVEYQLKEKKAALTNFMAKENVTRLDMGELGYVNCITATAEHVWVTTSKDKPDDAPEGVRSLKSILSKELFKRVTKRVVDVVALDELVQEGEINEDDIAPAHFVRTRSPYIKFEKG